DAHEVAMMTIEVFYSAEDQCYLARLKESPLTMTHGDTPAAAIRELATVLDADPINAEAEPLGDGATVVERILFNRPLFVLGRDRGFRGNIGVSCEAYTRLNPWRKAVLELDVDRNARALLWPFIAH